MSHFPGEKTLHTSSYHRLAAGGHYPTSTETKVVSVLETASHIDVLEWVPASIQEPLKNVIGGWLEISPKEWKKNIILGSYSNMGDKNTQ